MNAVESHVAERVRLSVNALAEQGRSLEALGQSMQELAGLSAAATAAELHHTSVALEAVAARALSTTLAAALVAERLATLARVLEVAP